MPLTYAASAISHRPCTSTWRPGPFSEDGEPVGRIYEARSKQVPEMAWFWSITSMHNWNRWHAVKAHDYASTLDEAKQQFLNNWEKLKAWPPFAG